MLCKFPLSFSLEKTCTVTSLWLIKGDTQAEEMKTYKDVLRIFFCNSGEKNKLLT